MDSLMRPSVEGRVRSHHGSASQSFSRAHASAQLCANSLLCSRSASVLLAEVRVTASTMWAGTSAIRSAFTLVTLVPHSRARTLPADTGHGLDRAREA